MAYIKPQTPIINWGHSLTKGLIFDFPFHNKGGTIVSDTNNLHMGTLTSGTPWSIGNYGTGVTLNGSSQKVTHTGFTLTSGQKFAFQAIFNTSTNTTDIMGVRNGDTGAGNMTQMRIQSNAIEFNHDFLIDTTNNKAAGAKTVTDGNWHNVICQYDGTKLYVYTDGLLDGNSGTLSTLTLTTTATWAVGTRPDFPAEWFNGKITLARAWKNRYFSVSEIQALNTNPWQIYMALPEHPSTNTIAGTPVTSKVSNANIQSLGNLANLQTI